MLRLDVEQLPLRGTTVIEASAGTGKTYTITSLFLRLLLEEGLTVDQILVVTYTRAATAELRDRIRTRLSVALSCARGRACEDGFIHVLCSRTAERTSQAALVMQLEQALSNIDQAPILTIHGFCQRVLRDHAFESGVGFALTLTAHTAPIIDEIADDYFTSQLFDTSEARAQLLYDEAGTLRALATRAGSGQGLRVIPEAPSGQLAALDAWLAAQRSCLTLWQRDRAQIVAAVAELKHTQHVAKWARQMDDLLTKQYLGFSHDKELAAGFKSFTRSGALAKLKQKAAPPAHPFFDAAERFGEEDGRLFDSMARERVAFRAGFVRYLHEELARRAQESEVRTFDGLVSDMARALAGERSAQLVTSLRRKYRAGLVDEFQDTDPAQYAMFKRIFADSHAPLLLIGDPKQAVYAFRGADVQAYLSARDDAGEHVFTLDVNRRSDRELVNALNQLYQHVDKPFLLPGIDYIPVSVPSSAEARFLATDGRAPLDLMLVDGPSTEEALRREIARLTALDIAGLLGSGARRLDDKSELPRLRELSAADIAVLCRTNREAYEVQQALSELGVPSVLSGDASVFDSEDAEHVERALTALAHPADPRAMRSFLCSVYGGCSAEDLLRLEHDDLEWDLHARQFRELHELFVSRGFTQALRGLCSLYRIEERLLTRPDGMRRITNLNHLGELLGEVSLTERLGPLGLLRWLATAQQDATARNQLVGDSHELRLESSETAVQLTTVHKSKGLEYPIVYCPYLYKSAGLRSDEKALVRFHDPLAEGALTLDLGSEQHKEHAAIAEQEALSEALRLLYVALTRAKHRVCLALPVHKPSAQAALIYTLLGGGSPERVKARLEELAGAEGFSRAVHELTERSAGLCSLRKLRNEGQRRLQPSSLRADQLQARVVRRALDSTSRTASFTALIAGRPLLHEAADHDALLSSDDEPSAGASPESSLVLEPFPRGAGPGKLLHEVLEHCAFDEGEEGCRATAERVIHARGYDLGLLDMLVRGLSEVLATPLDERGLSLADVRRDARINELEFLFPVAATLTARTLGRTFKAHGAPAADPSYARRVEALPFEALRGFLRGFIDLIFQHEGRFYLVDYKSNYLGAQPADYGQDALIRSLSEHHYFLQYHLYALALHRYLTHRLPGYSYDQHFGGVYYLYLRGMESTHPLRTGVFFDLPPRALIEALDRIMDDSQASLGEAP